MEDKSYIYIQVKKTIKDILLKNYYLKKHPYS